MLSFQAIVVKDYSVAHESNKTLAKKIASNVVSVNNISLTATIYY